MKNVIIKLLLIYGFIFTLFSGYIYTMDLFLHFFQDIYILMIQIFTFKMAAIVYQNLIQSIQRIEI
jgi:type IV secretory pathway TrbL component